MFSYSLHYQTLSTEINAPSLNCYPLPKIDKLHRIACLSKAAFIEISESKLDNSIFGLEIEIDGYNILHFDRNKHGGRELAM